MDKGIYTALSGGLAKAHDLEIIANNLANANTPGFKRDTGTFNEYLTEIRRFDDVEGLERDIKVATQLDARPSHDKSFVEMDGIYTDYRQGGLTQTGRPLDVGIEGNGFLEVLTPTGVKFTRQGNLNVSANGQLVTSNGYPVLARAQAKEGEGEGAAAPEQRVIQLGQGPVHITQDGILQQNGLSVALLSLQEFHEAHWLEKVGSSYYRNVHPDNIKTENGATQVHQGFLESSNVNAVSEMTRLIEATRAYESHMQAIKTYHEMDGKSANEIAKNG